MDNIPEFTEYFIKNINEINIKTLLKTCSISKKLLKPECCWQITDMIIGILSVYDTRPHIDNDIVVDGNNNDDDELQKFLNYITLELENQKLLCFIQDYKNNDHWFVAIGVINNVLVVELTNNIICKFYELITITNFTLEIKNIITGKIPDRFYNMTCKHTMRVNASNRKFMNKQTIDNYLL